MKRKAGVFGRAGCTALAIAMALAACADRRETATTPPADPDVTLSIANEGAEPLRCTILFGHWVEQGAGTVAPGEVLTVPMRRQSSDGALFVPRYDGRRMYVENLVCGPLRDWWARRADLSLLPLRAASAARFAAVCRMADRAACTTPAPI